MQMTADRLAVVAQATDLFWKKGYVETSVEEIVRATGLNRYALYNSFGGKREMLLEALAGFVAQRRAAFLEQFQDRTMRPLQAIHHMFTGFIEEIMQTGNGCLMCNTVSEIAPKDPDIAEVCRGYQQQFVDMLTPVLREAQQTGEMRADLEVVATAHALLTFKIGLATLAKAGVSHHELLGALEQQLQALSTPSRSPARTQAHA
ncbi:TetR/AcrR family transcriptional regulator [Parvularcula sp. IMCC14364]|uniref:TetR/AcrR family transcriptional regulator n=1 Tax=Parvularcula sp. IMCC14364 TaxID=3067902 RepID=UPI0027411D8A|nr:TetR/AcrR family transcriptional regulator [Parvularcula sp. IMCC14364]